jgi:hypothetical protein
METIVPCFIIISFSKYLWHINDIVSNYITGYGVEW